MPSTTKEWNMVQELYEMLDELYTDKQKVFVYDLFNNLNPYEPFLEQQSDLQEKWLYALYGYYVDGDEEAFEEIYDEF